LVQIKKHNIHVKELIVAILLILSGLLLHNLITKKVDMDKVYGRWISEKLNNDFGIINNELDQLNQILESGVEMKLSKFNELVSFPTFIYKNGRLLYWSDNKFIPSDTLIETISSRRFIDYGDRKLICINKPVFRNTDTLHILSTIPLYINYDITNEFLYSGFNPEIFGNSDIRLHHSNEFNPVYGPDDDFLFSIEYLPGYIAGFYWLPVLVFLLITAGIILLILFLWSLANHFVKQYNLWYGISFLLSSLVIVRILVLRTQFPVNYLYFSIFDPKYYASSLLNPSLGDLFINILFLMIFMGFIIIKFPHRDIIRLFQWSSKSGLILSVLAFLLQLEAIFFIYKLIQSLGAHSQWSMDITSGFSFSYFKWFSYLLFVLCVSVFLQASYISQKIIFKYIGSNHYRILLVVLIGIPLFIFFGYLFGYNMIVISIIGLLFMAIAYLINIRTIFVRLQYQSFVYIFSGFIISSIAGAFAINEVRQLTDDASRERFGELLIQENDPLTEFFLYEAAQKITNDVFIKNRLYSPFGSKEIIEEKIRRVHLNNYLDKFDINIFLYNSRGDAITQGMANSYFQIFNTLAKEDYLTEYENLYFYLSEKPVLMKRYLSFIPLSQYDRTIGYILLELKLKKIIPSKVYPRLLLDDRFSINYFEDQFDYALYRNDTLLNTSGSFNYEKDFETNYLQAGKLYSTGMSQIGYRHFGFNSDKGKVYIISAPIYPLVYVFANFSFLFIVLSFSFLLALIVYSVYFNIKGTELNYVTRIQLYLNLAFFIPLIVLSITTLSRTTTDYRLQLDLEYLKTAESAGYNLTSYMEQFKEDIVNIEELSNSLSELADFSELDMSIFRVLNAEGKLLVATQPSIYDKGLLANIVNPVALGNIQELGANSMIMDESFGKLEYKIAYVGMKSFTTGELIGVLSIPFFGSQEVINKNLTSLAVNILTFFTIIFIGFIFLSYVASNYLTFPIKFVTDRIRRTSLTGSNEPLQYESSDEIGQLVSEYNNMLLKLEESKKALAQSEKEAAWREMAKQVAHEIKNPLTPMKLTLQHLGMRLNEIDTSERAKFEKSINSLLHNIDTLSDIATSFSNYAQMPIPEKERFELIRLLKESINIYINNKEVDFITDIIKGEIIIIGDPSWIGRSLSNLIINGIQAVDKKVRPEIKLTLKFNSPTKILITVSDNGKGIPEEIREKIFMPNFSTKYTGSGIGLAIAKRAIEHAGGEIWFESKIGKGTTFYVELPVTS